MSEVIATLYTADARPVEITARPGEIQIMFLSPGGTIDRLSWEPSGCLDLEEALKTARLRVVSEMEP